MDKILEEKLELEYKKNILKHHIYFLSKHRGVRESLEYGKFIHSDKANFNIVFPLSDEGVEKISKNYYIFLPQWILLNEKMKLKYQKSDSITYMVLKKKIMKLKNNKKIIIRRANSLSDIEDFSIVQGRGFCETEDEFNEGYLWMREKNIKNLNDNTQNFYIAYDNEKPVGVLLSIYHNNIAGFYAVTTLPDYRKKGISTTLIQRAINDAINNNMSIVTLQTSTESYSHFFYRKIGFEDIFKCSILKAID